MLVTTPLWVASTRLKLQGVNYEGERSSQDKPSTYVGIVGMPCTYKVKNMVRGTVKPFIFRAMKFCGFQKNYAFMGT